ncbi:MAG: AraC family transcriptional regulator [Oscillospiraceae bacterium]|nr:AraC family transcriptional regulator [Oscillospiraceae bacterium]
MNWIYGIQNAIDYIEEHLTEDIDYNQIAAHSFSSYYHFQRVFSILCGFTVGEYIRNRRLSLAGAELAAGNIKVIDAALKYGYESPDSFARAFQKFHGILPSQIKGSAAVLNQFSRLVIKISLEGGNVMNYKIENKPEMTLVGFKRRFTGTPADSNRNEQEDDFYCSTRVNQYILMGMSDNGEVHYNILNGFDDNGYDFSIAYKINKEDTDNLEDVLGEDAKRFERIVLPAGLYFVCRTENFEYPVTLVEELRKKAVSQWLPASDYELDCRPEVSVYHWFYKEGDAAVNSSRYAEIWLPVVKK